MRFIDLSQPLYHGAPNCPAHPSPEAQVTRDHPDCGWRVEQINMVNHTGSHLDAPLHKIAGGKSISDFPLEAFAGPARIADLRPLEPNAPISAADLERTIPDLAENEIALLCTGWGDIRSRTDKWLYDSPYLAADGAQWLVDRGARAVGIDHYSIGGSRDPMNSETHTILLGNGLWVVEELKFPPEALVLPPPVKFMALPINFTGLTGSFCRPVLLI